MDARPVHRLPELEGLRGLLSWWVVLCHALTHSGYSIATVGRGWRILLHGDYAVDVFIILSGFVIHKLWHDKREPYRVFVARRFLRLWPAYAVCLLGALVLRPCISAILDHAPPAALPEWTNFVTAGRQTWQCEQVHFAAHLAAHAPMLHSAIPETLLPRSSIAFLGPAWSISLEWQFYLVAPLLFWELQKRRSLAWLLFAVAAGLGWMFRYTHPLDTWFPMEAFLPQKLLLFGIGVISHEIWAAFDTSAARAAPALLGLAMLVLFFTLSIPLALWLAVLSSVFASRSLLKAALSSAPLQFLGRVSYSTYLGHVLVLWAVLPLLYRFLPSAGPRSMFTALALTSVPLILLLSAGLHRWVEAPAIRFGHRIFES